MPIKVYYLDDEESLCNIFYEFVNSDQVHVTTFSKSDEAIDCCRDNPPDLMFIDYRLPGTTGDKVASNIDKSVPKILVTGDLSHNSSYSFEQVISKPCDFKEVQKIINTYL